VHDAGADAGVGPRLPAEDIQKIVRAHFDTFRACYEQGLARQETLSGRVKTRFVIGLDGTVKSVTLDCTTMPDDVAVECIEKGFAGLRFPEPTGGGPDAGGITVVYPLQFNAAD
jgi:hypothetical protein